MAKMILHGCCFETLSPVIRVKDGSRKEGIYVSGDEVRSSPALILGAINTALTEDVHPFRWS